LSTYIPDQCTIHRKKKYPCTLTNRGIEIDIAIEVRRKGATTPALLVFIECKNYKNIVQEEVVNSFSNTLSRVSEHNTKGYVVFPSKVAKSTIELAKKYGIGVIKFDNKGTAIVAERSFKSS